MCLPAFLSERSGRTSCPPKNIAKGPLVMKGSPPVIILNSNVGFVNVVHINVICLSLS